MGDQAAADYLPTIAFTAVLAWLLTGLATWYATRRGLLDHPGDRHSHDRATPRGGGAGLVAALVVVTAWLGAPTVPLPWFTCLAPGVVALAVLGWWDDHRSLSVRLRLTVQLAVTFYLLACASGNGWIGGVVAAAAAGLSIMWMTNLYNFMDGSNGMAALQGIFAGSLLAWLHVIAGDAAAALLCLLLVAACAGFLPWNLGRARVFMGDVGSLALGFALAGLLLYGVGSGHFGLPAGALVMALFLADSTLTLVARVIRGERWYNAHRQHLYQRLIARGWSHGRVAMLYQGVNLMLVLPGIGVAVYYPALAWPAVLAVYGVLAFGWYLLTRKTGVLARAG
jgi:UDP-N-acetylmuramyl pentapeptide phosphotransferase/UDP-N-acetylglucosamine-1-phosphate transferase